MGAQPPGHPTRSLCKGSHTQTLSQVAFPPTCALWLGCHVLETRPQSKETKTANRQSCQQPPRHLIHEIPQLGGRSVGGTAVGGGLCAGLGGQAAVSIGLGSPSPWTSFWVRVRPWMAGGGCSIPTSNPRGIYPCLQKPHQPATGCGGGKEACKDFFFKGVIIKISPRVAISNKLVNLRLQQKGDGGSFACISGRVTHAHYFVSPREAASPPTSHCCSGAAGIKWTNSVSRGWDSPHPSPSRPSPLTLVPCRLGTLP